MKIVPNSILFILVAFLVSAVVIAAPSNGPPPPEPPPPPGDSIDGNIALLLIVSLVYGIYKIYQLKLNKKTPI